MDEGWKINDLGGNFSKKFIPAQVKTNKVWKYEKLKLLSVPCKPKPVTFSSATFPSLLQVIPYHLHGLVVLTVEFIFHEDMREWFLLASVDFHFKRASTSCSTVTSCKCCFVLVEAKEEPYAKWGSFFSLRHIERRRALLCGWYDQLIKHRGVLIIKSYFILFGRLQVDIFCI